MTTEDIPGLQTMEAQKAYKQAWKVAEQNPADFLAIGRQIKKLEELNKGLLTQFIEKGPLGSRKTRYFLAIVKRFEGLDLSDEKLRKVGWTKLSVLAPYVNRTNVYDYLDKAKSKNAKQLSAFLKNKEEPTTAVTLYFNGGQRSRFDQIIESFGGHSNREAALMEALSNLKV